MREEAEVACRDAIRELKRGAASMKEVDRKPRSASRAKTRRLRAMTDQMRTLAFAAQAQGTRILGIASIAASIAQRSRTVAEASTTTGGHAQIVAKNLVRL
jgi:hypothetical protein